MKDVWVYLSLVMATSNFNNIKVHKIETDFEQLFLELY